VPGQPAGSPDLLAISADGLRREEPAGLRVYAPRPELARRLGDRLDGSTYCRVTDQNAAMLKRVAALLIAIILLSGCQIFEHVNSGPCVEDSDGICVPTASP
jgi:hypothetical protein